MSMDNKDKAFIRYQRQISVKEFGESGQQALSASSVLIVGCGGLGTLVSTYLAASGVGSLVLNDDDTIEWSNLPRQLNYREIDIGKLKVDALKSSLLARSSLCRIRTIASRMEEFQLSLEIGLADVVVDCSDNFNTRLMINRLCAKANTPLVSGAISGWSGHLALYDYQDNRSCYECLVDRDVIAEQTLNCETNGVISPVVGVIASLQALEVIKVITQPAQYAVGDNTTITYYDGLSRRFDHFEIEPNPHCESCSESSRGARRDKI